MFVYTIGEVFPHPELRRAGFDAPRAMIMPNGFFNIVGSFAETEIIRHLTFLTGRMFRESGKFINAFKSKRSAGWVESEKSYSPPKLM